MRFSEFSSKKGYTVEDANRLVTERKIKITEPADDMIAQMLVKYPVVNPLPYKMNSPNEKIRVYQGLFTLQQENYTIEAEGELFFRWLPKPACHFKGKILSTNVSSILLAVNFGKWKICIDSLLVGHCFVHFMDLAETQAIEGKCSGVTVLGDRSIPATELSFAIPNMKEVRCETTRSDDNGNVSVQNNRITLADDGYIITLDALSDYKERNDELKAEGGYLFQYAGKLSMTKGALTFKELRSVFHGLNTFLSFINGRRTAAMMTRSSHNCQYIYSDVTAYIVDSYEYVSSWAPQLSAFRPQSAWTNFMMLWKNDDHQKFLELLIHWYVEANLQSGYVEGAIMMAQTALELLYNWYVVEQKGYITGEDAKNISAANKIRLLLAVIRVPSVIPQGLQHLQPFRTSVKEINDGPDAIVFLRNSIVHAQLDKRRKFAAIPNMVKSDILELAVWYIELATLHILDYSGKYINRCSGKMWAGADEEELPWRH